MINLILLFIILLYGLAAYFDFKYKEVTNFYWLAIAGLAILNLLMNPQPIITILTSLMISTLAAGVFYYKNAGGADIKGMWLLGIVFYIPAIPFAIVIMMFVFSIIFGLFSKRWTKDIAYIVPMFLGIVFVVSVLTAFKII